MKSRTRKLAVYVAVAMVAALSPVVEASDDGPRGDDPPPVEAHSISVDLDVAGELAAKHGIPRSDAEDALAIRHGRALPQSGTWRRDCSRGLLTHIQVAVPVCEPSVRCDVAVTAERTRARG